MVYKLFHKKSSAGAAICARSEILDMKDKRPLELACVAKVSYRERQLADELHKPVTIKIYYGQYLGC